MNSAVAAVITNLDKKSQQFDLLEDGRFTPITIAAGETWRLPGRVRVRYHGRELNINEEEEFAIWNDHEFGPQRTISHTNNPY